MAHLYSDRCKQAANWNEPAAGHPSQGLPERRQIRNQAVAKTLPLPGHGLSLSTYRRRIRNQAVAKPLPTCYYGYRYNVQLCRDSFWTVGSFFLVPGALIASSERRFHQI